MLSKKYAQAYVHLFGADISLEDVQRIEKAVDFLNTNRHILFFLTVPTIDASIKTKSLYEFADRLGLPASINKLIDLILKHKRGELLAQVLKQIVQVYHALRSIHTFRITSSQPLSVPNRNVIEKFLAKRVEGTILYTYSVDRDLIAGIRAQSDTLLWECSVAQQLRHIQHTVL